jgi:protein-disulfide isomerase
MHQDINQTPPSTSAGALLDNGIVRFRSIQAFGFLFLGALCLAQTGDWRTTDEIPGVDWHNINGAKKAAAMKFIRTEHCTCGCDMMMAECRMKDPTCSYSRKEASLAMKLFAEGKNADEVRAEIKKVAGEPPPVLEDPVQISTAGDPSKGPDNARVTIVEFSDFQCPYCSKAVAEANNVVRAFPKDVRLVFKQFPLDFHAQAEFAAEAALAAQAQGKFWEMHDKMYAGFPDLRTGTIMRYAREIGLDLNRFTSEVGSHKYKARVQSEEQQGENAGVGGTPTFFINGKKYNGVFDLATVSPLIKKELR